MSDTQDPQELELDRELPSSPLFDDETPFATMMASFDEAAQRLGLGEVEYQILRRSDREIAVSIPVPLDNGSFANNHGPAYGTGMCLLSMALNYRLLPVYER